MSSSSTLHDHHHIHKTNRNVFSTAIIIVLCIVLVIVGVSKIDTCAPPSSSSSSSSSYDLLGPSNQESSEKLQSQEPDKERMPSSSSSSSTESNSGSTTPSPIFFDNPIAPTPFPNPPSWTFAPFTPPEQPKDGLRIGLTTILKKEHNYVSDWIKYHLAMGFDRIVIYDNEEVPTYANLLKQEGLSCCVIELPYQKSLSEDLRLDRSAASKIIVKHLPNRLLRKGHNQHESALGEFQIQHMLIDGFTHVAHYDIDEYLQLNKHENVRELVKYTLTSEHGIHWTCGMVVLNWIWFGTNGLRDYSPEPVPIRFTCGSAQLHHGMKVFFRTDAISRIWIHRSFVKRDPITSPDGKGTGHWRGCTTDNVTANDWVNYNTHREIVQLNHYQSKTWPENLHTRSRGSSVGGYHPSKAFMDQLVSWFNKVNINEAEDLRARNYFLKHVYKLSDREIASYPRMPGSKCEMQPNMTLPPGYVPTPVPPPPPKKKQKYVRSKGK